MIRVAIVDDDALTLELHRSFVEKVEGFEVVAECASGRSAVAALSDATLAVDLVLLDMTMPDGSGVEVLRRVRSRGSTVDAIAVTSVSDAETVRATASLGVVQYLVKPFSYATFHERMVEYREFHARRAQTAGSATQAEIDTLLTAGRVQGKVPLPKGLAADTLAAVGDVLRRSGDMTASEAAAVLGISRVSARRYLEYLQKVGAAERRARHGRPGRPENEYRWTHGRLAPHSSGD